LYEYQEIGRELEDDEVVKEIVKVNAAA